MSSSSSTEPVSSPTAWTRARTRAVPPERADVILVGCGLGGLTTGAYLSRLGYKVACFDQHYVAGGCATAFARGGSNNRYHFDVGLHYIGDCGPQGPIPSILGELGRELEFIPMDQDGFDTLIFPDFTFRVPADRDLYRQRLLDLFPEEKRGIDRYVRFLTEIDGLVDRMVFPNKVHPLAFLWFTATRGRLGASWSSKTLSSFLDTCTDNMQLKAVLSGQNGDYGIAPERVAAGLHAGVANHYFHGAYYPRGGGQAISDLLAAEIEARGGSIHLRCGIDRILVEGGRAVGVRTEDGRHGVREIRADAVVSNADLIRTLTELVGHQHLPSRWSRQLERFEMAEALFITYLGVTADMKAKGMKATNYWQFDTYDFDAAYRTAKESSVIEPTAAYITSASLKEPDSTHHAPEGVTSLEIMTLVPGQPERWGAEPGRIEGWDYKKNDRYLSTKEALEENLIGRLEALFPGTAESIVFKESATPMTHTRFTRASAGTSYGLANTPSQFQKNRPGYRGPIDGLYLTGSSTRAGHGIYGVMLGGRTAAMVVNKGLAKKSLPDALRVPLSTD
ncbi:MAG: NAD(P)/FAD-dependent oxidoreductase [Myxococcota bacterium]|nr:NAD(P)/FAD-dependent oxidoreductase [Myxococcota bacterium]